MVCMVLDIPRFEKKTSTKRIQKTPARPGVILRTPKNAWNSFIHPGNPRVLEWILRKKRQIQGAVPIQLTINRAVRFDTSVTTTTSTSWTCQITPSRCHLKIIIGSTRRVSNPWVAKKNQIRTANVHKTDIQNTWGRFFWVMFLRSKKYLLRRCLDVYRGRIKWWSNGNGTIHSVWISKWFLPSTGW